MLNIFHFFLQHFPSSHNSKLYYYEIIYRLFCPVQSEPRIPSSIPRPRRPAVHRYFCTEKSLEEIINISRTFIMANKYPEMQQLLLLHFHRSAGKDLSILRTMQWLIGNFSRCYQYHLVTFVVSLFPKMRIVACLPCQLRLLFTDYPRQLTPHREGCCKIINICICPRAAGCSIRMNYSGPYRIAMKKCVKLQSELFIALQTKVGASLQ